MLFDLIDLAKLRRAFVYALYLLLLFILQDLVLVNIPLAGVRAMLIPAAVVCVALFEGGVWGAMFGLAAGFFFDMGIPANTVMFTLLFPVLGFFTGMLGKYVLRRALPTALVLAAAALLLTAGCQMLRFFFADTSLWALLRTGLLQTLWSLPFTLLIYPACRAIAGYNLSE